MFVFGALLLFGLAAPAAEPAQPARVAFVAARNKTPLVILRGVSDLVGPGGGEAYGNLAQFEAGSERVMRDLLRRLEAVLPELARP